MQIIKSDKLFAVIGLTCNRAVEEIVDDYHNPPEFYTAYVIIDDSDNVVKYRKDKRWYAPGRRTPVEALMQQLMLLCD